MSDDLKLVYTGSRVEGLFLKEILEENGIIPIYRDTLSSSVQAGWADGSPEDTIRILVASEEFNSAQEILNEYFNNRDSQ